MERFPLLIEKEGCLIVGYNCFFLSSLPFFIFFRKAHDPKSKQGKLTTSSLASHYRTMISQNLGSSY
jgi:hypothetical protein